MWASKSRLGNRQNQLENIPRREARSIPDARTKTTPEVGSPVVVGGLTEIMEAVTSTRCRRSIGTAAIGGLTIQSTTTGIMAPPVEVATTCTSIRRSLQVIATSTTHTAPLIMVGVNAGMTFVGVEKSSWKQAESA